MRRVVARDVAGAITSDGWTLELLAGHQRRTGGGGGGSGHGSHRCRIDLVGDATAQRRNQSGSMDGRRVGLDTRW